MMSEEQRKDLINESLSKIDHLNGESPELSYFFQLIQNEKAIKDQEEKRAFIAFVGVALLVLFGLLMTIMFTTQVFLGLQIIAPILATLILVVKIVLDWRGAHV